MFLNDEIVNDYSRKVNKKFKSIMKFLRKKYREKIDEKKKLNHKFSKEDILN